MLDAVGLILKHRSKGVLVDANLLVLFLVGNVNRRRILDFKRTQNFSLEDFDLLERLIRWFSTPLLATPHVLSQVSDLTDLPGTELRTVRELFRRIIEQMHETYDASQVLVADPLFERLGLADAGIATLCSRGTLVLTSDVQLHIALQQRGAEALNFNHLRQIQWEIH